MTIRVTPIGGEPIELPEDTPSVVGWTGYESEMRVYSHERDGKVTVVFRRLGQVIPEEEVRPHVPLARAAELMSGNCFVRIGDAWPLCEIETWRARAERLERELEAMRDRWRRAEERSGRCIPAAPEFAMNRLAPWVTDLLQKGDK